MCLSSSAYSSASVTEQSVKQSGLEHVVAESCCVYLAERSVALRRFTDGVGGTPRRQVNQLLVGEINQLHC